MGAKVPKVIQPNINRVNCQDPGSVKKYNATYTKLLLQENVPQLMGKLKETITPGHELTEEQKIIYKLIDAKKVQAASQAKKQSRKLYLSGAPFSGIMTTLWKKIEAWKLALQRYMPRVITRRGKKTTIQCKIKQNSGNKQCPM